MTDHLFEAGAMSREAADALLGTNQPPTLDEIMLHYGSDKASEASQPWQWAQNYTQRTYEQLFEPLRHQPIRLLEIGWGEWSATRKNHADPDNGGRSARAWHTYFDHPGTRIVVVEVERKNFADAADYPRIDLHDRTDATDPDSMRALAGQVGPFDVIIDDGSHISSKTIASFKLLWPHLKPGGLYVIEDLHSSRHDYYFGPGEAQRNPNLPGPTAIDFFKRIADEAFFNGQRMKGPAVDGDPRSWDIFPRRFWLGYAVEEVRFCAPQLIVVRKRTQDRYPPDTPAVPAHPR